jgi:hypothetical protein
MDDADVLDDYLLGVNVDEISSLKMMRRGLSIPIVKELVEFQIKNSYCQQANSKACGGVDLPANPIPRRAETNSYLESAE